ncbi:MAG: S8 family serine peptidase [Clostridia bacterium]|nr:S8 family serine peptidase [Clostridia bacterium]
MIKIISVILTAVMTFASAYFSFLPESIDSAVSAVFGVPLFQNSVSEGFLGDIDDSDVVALNEGQGYCKNLIVVFLNENVSLFEKYRLFRDEPMVLLGWSCPADLYVAYYNGKDLNALVSYCDKLTASREEVSYASPVTASKKSPDYTPDDPFCGTGEISHTNWNEPIPTERNWWLEAIDARQAWDYDRYMNDINVGVIDCGVNLNHEDLKDKTIKFPSSRQEKRNIPDDHGCHVTGIIGAQADNGKGIAGVVRKCEFTYVDWQPEKDKQEWNTDIHIFFGFIDAVKAGAKVINLSLGATGNIEENESEMKYYVPFEENLYSALISVLLGHGYDFLICQSAGNGNDASQPVDAKYNGTFTGITKKNALSLRIGVSRQDIVDRIIVVSSAANRGGGEYIQSSFSNIGKQISVSAPGSSVYSCSDIDDEYCYMSGTSMASPVVAGVAALVWSVNPDFTGAQVKAIVCSPENSNATVPPIEEEYRDFPDLDYIEYPMVNANLSVQAALMKTYDMGKVEGDVSLFAEHVESVTLIQNGETSTYTVIGNNTFNFAAPAGEAEIAAYGDDGTLLGSTTVTIVKDACVNVEIKPAA